jgi:hypothetical protein
MDGGSFNEGWLMVVSEKDSDYSATATTPNPGDINLAGRNSEKMHMKKAIF